MRRARVAFFALGAACVAGSGCNLITGADSFVIGLGGKKSKTSSASGTMSTGVGGSGVGGATVGTGGASSTLTGATGVTITEIDVYQAMKSKVMAGGAAVTPTVRLVAGRPATVRVFTTTSGKTGGAITARLTFAGHTPIEVPATNVGNSSESVLSTTTNFAVPAGDLTVGAAYTVEFVEDQSTSTNPSPGARFPASGSQSLALETSFHTHVTIVPVVYAADGSNRMPDTSPGQIKAYQDAFMAMYPTTGAIITVGTPYTWSQAVSANGSGWQELLQAMSDHRIQSGAPSDEFYFGAFDPGPDEQSFCGGGCVAGLGFIGDPSAESTRAAIGLGFGGDVSTYTAVHETGHNHGRQHSPCGGASSPDPGYPYPGAQIGVWGLDSRTNQLLPPNSYFDVMGYCDPKWISDYVYESILSFKQQLGGTSYYFPPESLNQTYERVTVGGSGSPKWYAPMVMPRPPLGGDTPVTIHTASGVENVIGHLYRYDHVAGGVLYIKQPASAITGVDVQLDAGLVHMTR